MGLLPVKLLHDERNIILRFHWLVLSVFALASLFVLGTATTHAQVGSGSVVMVSQDPSLGPILTDSQGMTLYVFAADTPDASNCEGRCAVAWPPFQPSAGDLTLPDGVSGTLGVITRDDGTQQVTYNDMPLYYYLDDATPGDTTGQGIQPPNPLAYGGAWYVASPS